MDAPFCLHCLQLEASCLHGAFHLQLCLGAFLLIIGAFLLTAGASLLTVETFCLQWESVSNKHLNGL